MKLLKKIDRLTICNIFLCLIYFTADIAAGALLTYKNTMPFDKLVFWGNAEWVFVFLCFTVLAFLLLASIFKAYKKNFAPIIVLLALVCVYYGFVMPYGGLLRNIK